MLVIVALFMTAASSAQAASTDCAGDLGLSSCDAKLGSASLTVSGTRDIPGTAPSRGTGGGDADAGDRGWSTRPVTDTGWAPTSPTAPVESEPVIEDSRAGCWRVDSGRIDESLGACADAAPEPEEAPGAEPEDAPEAALPTITLADLASFAPRPARPVTEPDGAGLIGLPVNLVAPAETHTATGSLFGFPLTARFTPVEYVFQHGDGTTRTSRDPGSTWAELGTPQFAATATSHAYAERGTYSTAVTTRYAAEVDLGAGFTPVDGLVDATSSAGDIRIYESSTALVAYTCTENPAGPGC